MHEITKNSPEPFQNKQTSLKCTVSPGKQNGFVCSWVCSLWTRWKDNDCWPVHPGQSPSIQLSAHLNWLISRGIHREKRACPLSAKSQLPYSLGLKAWGNLPRRQEWSRRMSADGIVRWSGEILSKLSLSFPPLKSFKPRWRHCGKQSCICPLCQQFTMSE